MRVSKRKKSSFLRNSHFIIIYFSEKFIFSLMTGITILQVSSGSSESGNPTSLPALESSSSSESWATFRAEIAAENEAEIYARIRSLQGIITTTFLPRIILGSMRGLFAITWIKLSMFPIIGPSWIWNILNSQY